MYVVVVGERYARSSTAARPIREGERDERTSWSITPELRLVYFLQHLSEPRRVQLSLFRASCGYASMITPAGLVSLDCLSDLTVHPNGTLAETSRWERTSPHFSQNTRVMGRTSRRSAAGSISRSTIDSAGISPIAIDGSISISQPRHGENTIQIIDRSIDSTGVKPDSERRNVGDGGQRTIGS